MQCRIALTCDRVQETAWLQDVSVLCKEALTAERGEARSRRQMGRTRKGVNQALASLLNGLRAHSLDDPPPMLGTFVMRIRESEEELLQLEVKREQSIHGHSNEMKEKNRREEAKEGNEKQHGRMGE